jgi:hypothetical protein
MKWEHLWASLSKSGPVSDQAQRDRSARVREAEAMLQRAIADEAESRGRKDSAKYRRKLAKSLEDEAAIIRLSDEYDVITSESDLSKAEGRGGT